MFEDASWKSSLMTGLRSYGDPCGIARALDVVGERWALLIVRELLFGPKRFSDLRGSLGTSPNVLSQRLGELEASGVVWRRSAGGALYELTDWGHELHPFLLQLGRWGAHSSHQPTGDLSVDALMAALEATFQPDREPELNANYDLRLGEERFSVDIGRRTIAITRGTPRRSDAVIDTDPATLRALVFGDLPLEGAPVQLRGDNGLARTFFRLFARP
jgi:DNA-binding HxlR family transcriptional regulator